MPGGFPEPRSSPSGALLPLAAGCPHHPLQIAPHLLSVLTACTLPRVHAPGFPRPWASLLSAQSAPYHPAREDLWTHVSRQEGAGGDVRADCVGPGKGGETSQNCPPGPSHNASWRLTACPLPVGSQASCIFRETTPAPLLAGPTQSSEPGEAVPHHGLWVSARPQFSHGPRKRFHGMGTESLSELQVNFHILTQDIPSSSWRWGFFLALSTFQGLHALAPSSCLTIHKAVRFCSPT